MSIVKPLAFALLFAGTIACGDETCKDECEEAKQEIVLLGIAAGAQIDDETACEAER